MTQQTIILVLVFAYFAFGVAAAISTFVLSSGLTGKSEWALATALFFAWPIMYLLQMTWIPLILAGLAAAAFMTWLVSLLLNAA